MTDDPTERDVEALLRKHVSCNMVTSREGMTIWSCGVRTPKPDPDSSVGYADLHRAHVAVVLAERIAEARREGDAEALIEFAGSVKVMDAIYRTVAAHPYATETDPPEGVEPYNWCACGWRSDNGGGMAEAASATWVHLSNVLHAAVVQAFRDRAALRGDT